MSRVYFNMVLLNASSAVKEQVMHKLEEKLLEPPKFFKKLTGGYFRKRIIQSAVDKAEKTVEKKPEVVTRRLSTKISENFPKQMKQQGVIVSSEVCWCEGSYFVVAIDIQQVCVEEVVEVRGYTQVKPMLFWLFNLLPGGTLLKKYIETGVLPRLVARLMRDSELGATITNMMEEGGLEVEINVCSSSEQADYFFQLNKDMSHPATIIADLSPHWMNKPASRSNTSM